MSILGSKSILGLFIFTLVSFCVFSQALAIQNPNDTYDVGPDPIANSLSAQDQAGQEDSANDLIDLELDQLANTEVMVPAMQVEIETVSRTTQTLARTPSAVYVVTNEMIRRSGARNVPEILRTVPGVNVARINASGWAISIRGFNSRFAKYLLVQVDGVAIYSPTHSGVFWEREYVMLEDVERIEVIRGPGAAVWGVNAVNGVINIVTKSSKNTKGWYADGGGGNEHLQFGDFRVGGQRGNVHWRMFATTMKDDCGFLPAFVPDVADDNPSMNQGGFRMDWTPNRHDTVTIQGDFYQGLSRQAGTATPPATVNPMSWKTARMLVRWQRKIDEDTDWAFQTYYYNPYAYGSNINQVATFDLDFQYHFSRGRHDVVWGFGYRNTNERWVGWVGQPFEFTVFDNEWIPSYFVQDTVTMVEDRFFLTLGSKFDHNSVTNFEYQPTVRATWTPDERTSIWGAVSRAARTPSLVDRMLSIVNPTTYSRPGSEHVIAYEAGIRRAPSDRFFWELATFFNRYDELMASVAYFQYENVGRADTYGFELNATYEVNKKWHLTGWYALLITDARYPIGYNPLTQPGESPRNQFYFQSAWDLGQNVSLDAMFRYVDSLSHDVGVDSYFAGDIRLAWRPRKHLEFSVVGQNLLAGNHFEFQDSSGAYPTEVQPGVYGMVSWRH
ncbi:MAG: TonB-dependent receptor [Planctomycetia bacterium]|jgi:iron complex outermembrane receptor protein